MVRREGAQPSEGKWGSLFPNGFHVPTRGLKAIRDPKLHRITVQRLNMCLKISRFG
jgi:hypothetical protein